MITPEIRNRNTAIKMSGIRKQYRLGEYGGRTLQEDLQSWWARRRGREDPNERIGSVRRKGTFWALDGIDLTIHRGERVGIIGANGAGKTTLLKLISRVTAPTEGEIDIYGRVSSMLEVGTGFHREMTGRENIYMNGSILGMTREEIDARMDDIIEFSEVGEFIDTPVKRYSSGMFVKLAFSVAAHLSSEIIIMDEVLAVGDMAFQNKCLERMRRAADEQGRTVLYVSHNMSTIRRLCERCIVLDHGHIVYDGDVEQAIGVYMDRSLNEDTVDMDLSAKSHSGAVDERVAVMERLRLLEMKKDDEIAGLRAAPVYESGEKMYMLLDLTLTRPVDDLLLRVTLRTDSDVGVGTAWLPLGSLGPGPQQAVVSFPLERLAKGVFYVSLGLCVNDEIGRGKALDHITRAFRIEVEGSPAWNTQAYGSVRF
ncbi:MAG: ATP-binding cassette domain-containing protein [Lachnospiraceae bacterium]|nr:ATP-binding cassette domain-containing protein [Lachnospiraceae bacterium]